MSASAKTAGGSTVTTVTLPSKVLVTYVRKGLLIDLVTAAPIAWISMLLEASCAAHSTGLLMARGLRIFRVTRVVKLFRTYKVRMWMRRLQRVTGNTSIMQVMNLVLLLGFLNHIWTCISWVVQSVDAEGFDEFKERVGIRETSDRYDEYSLTFMKTLQALFAIESYIADTKLEAWFGSITLALAVFISATMLSKILEIWQMANEAQTQRDSRINTVMQFTSRNGISTDLRDEVLDYFEFRFSNPSSDFERFFLDDLPSEMQTRMISQMFPDALEKSALFKAAPEMFVSHLIVKMAHRPMPTMPNQVILKQGAFNSEMFLLKSGTVDVTVEDEEGKRRQIKVLGQGATFGDLSMWMDSRQAATVTSREFCQLHKLDRHDLEEALLAFPEMSNIIASQALAYCLSSRAMCMALEGIGAAAAERIGRRMARNKVDIEPGMALYGEGDEAHGAFIVRKGRVEVTLLAERLESMQDARCVGFEALFTGRLYQETVRATTPVVAYWVSSEDMIELFASDLLLLERIEHTADRWYRVERSHRIAFRWALLAEDLVAANPVPCTPTAKDEGRWKMFRTLSPEASALSIRSISGLGAGSIHGSMRGQLPGLIRNLGQLQSRKDSQASQDSATTELFSMPANGTGPRKSRRASMTELAHAHAAAAAAAVVPEASTKNSVAAYLPHAATSAISGAQLPSTAPPLHSAAAEDAPLAEPTAVARIASAMQARLSSGGSNASRGLASGGSNASHGLANGAEGVGRHGSGGSNRQPGLTLPGLTLPGALDQPPDAT